MEQDIHTLVGVFQGVLRPFQRSPPIERSPVMVFWDTEYDDGGLISSQFGWHEDGEFRTEILFLEELDRESLRELIVGLVGEHSKIHVISHFSQSELKHLTDLWEMSLSVINKSIYARHRELRFIDSFSHFLCGLDRMGRSVGIPKIDIGDRIRDMRELLREDPELFRAYALRDVEVLALAWCKRRDFVLDRFGVDILNCVTTAHTSINIFKSRYLGGPIEPTFFDFVKKVRKKPDGSWKEYYTRDHYYSGSKDKRYTALKAYWGGRREAFGRGLLREDVEIWDVASMYPHLALLPLPLKETKWTQTRGLRELLDGEGYVHCRFRFEPGTPYPMLPLMHSKFPKLVFPLSGETWCTTPELRLAESLGCTIDVVDGWVFYPSTYEEEHPLRDYLLDCIEIKNDSEGGTVEYEVAKLMMNSIIGKFMQRSPIYSVEDSLQVLRALGYDLEALRGFLSKQVTRQRLKRPRFVSQNWSPEWGALILGRARAVIGDLMATSKALTGHTDSVIIRKGSKVQCPSLDLMRSLGSDLIHEEQYDGDSFWICRSAVYTTLRDGKALKPTHHGYPVNRHEDFGDIIEHNLGNPGDLISKCSKTHLVTVKEALRTGKPLGGQEVKTYNINWVWDDKRRFNGQEDQPWTTWTETEPWESIEELLSTVNPKRPSRMTLPTEKVVKIRELKGHMSTRAIARVVGCSQSSVSKYLSE